MGYPQSSGNVQWSDFHGATIRTVIAVFHQYKYCVDALELSERKNEGYGSLGGICRYPAWKKVNKVAGEWRHQKP